MKIQIELDESNEKLGRTRVWIDGVEVSNRTTEVMLRVDPKEYPYPQGRIRLLKHRDGQPYVNTEATDAAREVIVLGSEFRTEPID